MYYISEGCGRSANSNKLLSRGAGPKIINKSNRDIRNTKGESVILRHNNSIAQEVCNNEQR